MLKTNPLKGKLNIHTHNPTSLMGILPGGGGLPASSLRDIHLPQSLPLVATSSPAYRHCSWPVLWISALPTMFMFGGGGGVERQNFLFKLLPQAHETNLRWLNWPLFPKEQILTTRVSGKKAGVRKAGRDSEHSEGRVLNWWGCDISTGH